MLSSSLRRTAWAPIGLISSVSRTPPRFFSPSSATRLRAAPHSHHRRYSSSSSKPPVPPSDGSRRIDASSQAPSKSVRLSGEKREGKSPRRRGKDSSSRNGSSRSNQDGAFTNLPSVPSTQHLQPHDIHIASFFSIHRPISVTCTVPSATSVEAFETIFLSKKPSRTDPEDVIFTLSGAIRSLESAAHTLAEQEDQIAPVSSSSSALGGHAGYSSYSGGMDITELKMSIEEYARRLRPFHPPPAPVPFNEAEQNDGLAVFEEPQSSSSRQVSTYSAVFTIRESTHADGRKTYEARASPFVPTEKLEAPAAYKHEESTIVDISPAPRRTYIERVYNTGTMHALSTKRRRKLKMKKHKFKKLLRRTRTLRRKLDKA